MPGWYPIGEPEKFDWNALSEAYRDGDLEKLKTALHNPEDFPNVFTPRAYTPVLEYAIYHSPLPFVRTLLELGANPKEDDGSGFPPLMAALSTQRPDKYELIELLLQSGADIQQRGVNNYTPLHYAASQDDIVAVEILLRHGADPDARTNIDEYATPLEEAEYLGKKKAAEALRRHQQR